MWDGWESLALSSVFLSGSKRVGRNGGVEVVKFVGATVGQESGAGHEGTGAIGMQI
jgi:hypothetical protein